MFRAERPPGEKQSRAARRRSRETRRRRFLLVGGALLSLVILGAWFPANALYHQHANLASAQAELNTLHKEDAALAQEKKNLSDAAEISRIAREQFQLVSPGQQAFEVLPKPGSARSGNPYSGDPALSAPVAPSSASVLPPGSATATAPTNTAAASTVHTAPITTAHRRARASGEPSGSGRSAAAPGLVGRMLNALEFWR